jgi:hypothetical protein
MISIVFKVLDVAVAAGQCLLDGRARLALTVAKCDAISEKRAVRVAY